MRQWSQSAPAELPFLLLGQVQLSSPAGFISSFLILSCLPSVLMAGELFVLGIHSQGHILHPELCQPIPGIPSLSLSSSHWAAGPVCLVPVPGIHTLGGLGGQWWSQLPCVHNPGWCLAVTGARAAASFHSGEIFSGALNQDVPDLAFSKPGISTFCHKFLPAPGPTTLALVLGEAPGVS